MGGLLVGLMPEYEDDGGLQDGCGTSPVDDDDDAEGWW